MSWDRVLPTLGVLALLSIAVAGLGFSLAWVMDSTAGYHGIMMLFLMPMLMMSGAFFPIEDAHWLISWVRHVNPMTYGVGALRHALQGEAPGCPTFTVCLIGTAMFAVAMFALGTFVVTRRRARDAI
jgi:ABC-2 type transport system permease protein